MNTSSAISRREFLNSAAKAASVATAIGWITTAHMGSALAYEIQANSELKAGKLLTKAQLTALRAVSQTIIPATDTPGAGDLDCHGFVDHQLVACHSAEQQQAIIRTIKMIATKSEEKYQLKFESVSSQEQIQLLEDIEQLNGYTEKQRDDFKFLKQLIAFGYFTSQVGATQALVYQPVPGGFKGSIPADKDTKSSGSLPYY